MAAQWNNDKTINNTVVDTTGQQFFSTTCSDGAGGVIVAWWDDRDNDVQYDVVLQRIDANGVAQWTKNGVALNSPSSGFSDMDITADGSGGAIVSFIAGSGASLNIMAQRINASGQLQWNSGNPVTVCNAVNAQFNIRVVSDGDGSSVVVWEDERAGSSADDIYAQRLDGNGTPQWTANGNVVNAAVNVQEFPEAVTDGNGGVIVTWRDFRNGSDFDLYAQHLDNTGNRVWAPISGVVISTAVNNQNFPKICTDGSNGAIIAWQDFRNGTNTDIYAQRVNAVGAVQWTADGQVLCNTANVQEIKDIAFTGDGAAVVWIDYPQGGSFVDYDLLAQKIDLTGTVVWTTNGEIVCNAADQQNNCEVSSDGSNGAIFVWMDQRLGIADRNIYAQRLDNNGAALWAANGVIVCSAAGDQGNPHIVTTNCTSVFTWDDQRNGTSNGDIFATSFDCSGNVSSALPLHFISFTAAKNNNNIALKWITENEVNTLNFEIERSTNGINFMKLATLPATGNSYLQNIYSFNDLQPTKGNNYYRLKQIDHDGKFEYSKSIHVLE